jgi:PAS domain S-box-containing protein
MRTKDEAPLPPPNWYRWAVQSIRGYACFTMDLKTRVVTWDEGAADVFGYRREDVLGQDARFIFTPGDIEKRAPEKEVATAVGHLAARDERWHVRKDGSVFWASGLMMVMKDDSGRHIGFVKIVRECPSPATTASSAR